MRSLRLAGLCLVPAILLAGAPSAAAELRVAAPFGDGMVIQRQVAVPVRGSAAAGSPVSLTFAGRTYSTRADDAGRWRIDLAAHEAGGPYEMTLATATAELRLRDLLVGDVWLCSGQSNMEWVVRDSLDAAAEIAAAGDASIRHFKVPRSWAESPQVALIRPIGAPMWGRSRRAKK